MGGGSHLGLHDLMAVPTWGTPGASRTQPGPHPGTSHQSPAGLDVFTSFYVLLYVILYVRFTSCFTQGLDASTQGLDAPPASALLLARK